MTRIISFLSLFIGFSFNFLWAQTPSAFVVEVGSYAQPVEPFYFKKLSGVYEVLDINYIYRYYIDAKDLANAKELRAQAVAAGHVHARVVDIEKLRSQCDYFCDYTPPKRTRSADWTMLRFSDQANVSVKDIQSVFFDYNSELLREKSKMELTKLGIILYQNPSYWVLLRGHTDDHGTEAYNELLSQKRAENARDFLVRGGIDIGRIHLQHLGSYEPIARNKLANGADSEDGRQFNRRVEIILYDKDEKILNIVNRIYVPDEIRGD